MLRRLLPVIVCAGLFLSGMGRCSSSLQAADGVATKKIVLIAGKKSHGPEGNGIHDYPWSVKLLRVMLDNSNVADQVRVEFHLDGWPADERTLNDADAIMIISDGRDGDKFEEAPHFLTEEHRQSIARQIARGCGFLTFHFSTFTPDKYADDILSWSGGYFDWETDGQRQWHSAIKTLDADVQLGTPSHPALRGVEPFKLREEFYYNIRFAANDSSLKPLLVVPALEGRPGDGNVVAWAKERADGGRGFGTTCGHFYDNWQQANFRKLILNALVWAAKGKVPAQGVEARYYTQAEITSALSGKEGTDRAGLDDSPIKALILTGDQYPGHLWKDTTPALKEALLQDPRMQVDVSENIEDLATVKITGYDLLVLNYCNWKKPGLSDAAKAGFVKYLSNGGGLIIIHFANGAFHFSLPEAGESDWPEFRKICRRVWDHTPNKSGHDAYGKFIVEIAAPEHPITKGMEPFETVDELYFRQQGEEPIEILATAKSTVTGRDEPMAFVYQYGKGRVMQTVLGHAAESLRTPGVVDLIRRSAAWVADRNPTLAVSQSSKKTANSPATADRLGTGKFGKALDALGGGLTIDGHERYRQPPLTVECWAKLPRAESYNILVAQELKTSATHWELFTMAGNGRLTAYFPGMKPDHVNSDANVVDDRWHYLAMIYEPERVRLYVDGKIVADQTVEFLKGASVPGGLAIGQLVDKAIGCSGLIDEVRISRGARTIAGVPSEPFVADEQTLGLWRLDEIDAQGRSPDASSHKQGAKVGSTGKKPPSTNAFYHWSRDVVGFDWAEQDSVDNRWNQSDVGPFLASIVPMPGQPPVAKGLSIKVGDNASVCYDTQTMALRSAWAGGFLKFDPARYGIISPPQMAGDVQFVSSPDAGWVAKSVRFLGHRVHNRRVLLDAEVDGTLVRESPGLADFSQHARFIRSLQIGPSTSELRLRLGRIAGATRTSVGPWDIVTWKSQDRTQVAAVQVDRFLGWSVQDGDVQLLIKPRDVALPVTICVCTLTEAPDQFFKEFDAAGLEPVAFEKLIEPGEADWPEPLVTAGTIGTEPGPYQVDTLTIPFDNPGKILFFITGHDFFSDGDIAVCTVHGDVWRVSGVDKDLKELRWRRYASGLFQPLGLKIIKDVVHVLGRDRITKLHDENGDGFADRYENFSDLYETSPSGHDYITCLETDAAGNFYFVHAKHGVQRISKDGKRLETIATGLRNPNGMSVSPSGEITAAPQEGEWTPASAIFMVRPGDHFGYGGPQVAPQRLLGYDPPLCWIPRLVDNSCAGQCWTPNDSWGLPANSLLHLSFGQCKLLLTLREQVAGVWQGGVVPLPMKFSSGVNRARFSPRDGQLYVSGLKGWVTSAVQDGCLHRVRYVGGPVPWPVRMKSYRNGIALEFGEALDRETAANPENYSVQACNYRYAKSYGSSDWRPSQPTVEGRDEWDVASATLLDDQRTVFLEIPDLAPVMQVVVNWSITSAQQAAVSNSLSGSLHRLSTESFRVPESSRKPRPGRLTAEEEARLIPGVLFTLQQENAQDLLRARLLACDFAAHEPPTSRLAAGPFTLKAAGFVKAPISGEYRFRVDSSAPVQLRINNQLIDDPTLGLRLHKGYNRVELSTKSSPSGELTCRLLWQSDTFAEEPVPATVWFHEGTSDAVQASRAWHQGRELFQTFRCDACHQSATPLAARPTEFRAPELTALKSRVSDRWLQAWIMNPRAIRHDAEMPQLFDEAKPADRQAVADIAAYLLNHGEPAGNRNVAAESVDGEKLYEDLGCITCHRFTPPTDNDSWYRTSLHYTSERFPNGTLTDYLLQPQRHHRFTRMPDFRLNETEATALANYVNEHSRGRIEPGTKPPVGDAKRGWKIFLERRCGQCHGAKELTPPSQMLVDRTLSADSLNRGCLAEDASARKSAPAFPIASEQRAALREFLKSSTDRGRALSPAEQASYLVRRLNCTACHHLDHQASPRGEIVSEESERGVAAPALPNLTWAGDKLHEAWLARLFRGETPRKLRPWLTARMPAFPAYAAALAHGLAAEYGHSSPATNSPAAVDPELAEIGRRLTLKDHGLDCRQCHAVAGQQPTGDDKTKIAPGIDFAETKHRLRTDFYRRFVLDPPRFDVAIRMPKLSLDGKTTQAVQIFEGDAPRQFEALRHYILSLPDLPPSE